MLRNCIFVFFCLISLCYSEVLLDAQEIVGRIKVHENEIRDVVAKITGSVPSNNNQIAYEYEWGYAGGKEFYTGTKYSFRPEKLDPKVAREFSITKTFDGEKEMLLRIQHDDASGTINSIDPETFRAFMTPNTLLGFDARELSRQTLGEVLSESKSLTIWPKYDEINGHKCIVIEALNVETDPEVKRTYDVRVWVDPDRDYRPLRFEKYFGFDGNNRWKIPCRVVENIKLQKFGDIWFPVAGERTTYGITGCQKPSNLSQEEFEKLTPEEVRKQGIFSYEPLVPKRKLVIDDMTVKINASIPEERFSIKFPQGCRVWDHFWDMGYTVGGKDEILSSGLGAYDTIPNLNVEKENSKENINEEGIHVSSNAEKVINTGESINVNDMSQRHEKSFITKYYKIGCIAAVFVIVILSLIIFKMRRGGI